ncbi:microtubule motor protein [Cryptococcus gattii E566]|uniref:Microtubule motor, putative n=2 Tax=Cryptococcus gattii TaxID=37769 RepID=E6R0Y5_CRYGW|nr:Microtubule motor, putative [Cryptococcus gattii WM276]ADV20465.1 Microtubule motor, putative [Cryptococcus gattii WM276]KIR77078.1 microtubule motor protein [Cryptococcus gattii EJB2]KIY31580.1 microtubule motor protein [Cryptococcus gattii E566]
MSKSIACHVRLRPSKPSDGKVNEQGIVINGNKISALNVQGDKRYHFEFEKCHDEKSTQEEVFEHVEPLLDQAWKGINTTIFSYGVTGAGKTHTMQGTKEEPGLIPRAVKAILQRRAIFPASINISMSYVEILKDEVYDLLGSRTEPRKREIRMSAGGQNVIADLVHQRISSWEEFEAIYDTASKTRKTASTKLNSSSSRSHAILTIHLEMLESSDKVNHGKICFTDLAGSENNNLTGNDRERMRESSAINTSLTTLGKVVDALNVIAQRGGDGTGVFVPYRESKLTRLLQDALGGSSLSLLICCLAPGEKFAKDAINTLQYTINPQAPFKIHTEGCVSLPRPSLGRPALAPLIPNVCHKKQNLKAGLGSGGKGNQKDKMAVALTEEQLEKRIQMVVSQEMANEREKERQLQGQLPQQPTYQLKAPPNIDAKSPPHALEARSMSEEEKDNRAKAIVKHARRVHQSGDLGNALYLYKKAYGYAPQNQKLAMRITELQLAIEGILPPPPLSGRSGQENQHLPSTSHLKRSRAPHGSMSLAELSWEGDENTHMGSNKKPKN